MTPRRTTMHNLLTATVLAAGLSVGLGALTITPAHADGWRGHERFEPRGHEWREHEWREHEWREHHGWYRYGYGYAPGAYAYPGYYVPAPAYEPPPSFTVVVPFR